MDDDFREPQPKEEQSAPLSLPRAPLLAAFLLALAAFLLFVELGGHGRSLDDSVQRKRGEGMLAYLAEGDRAALPSEDATDLSRGDRLYGPFAATISSYIGRSLGPLLAPEHASEDFGFQVGLILFFLLFLWAAMLLGARAIGDAMGAILTGLLLLAQPRILGLACVNPSDVPAAAGMAWAILLLLRWVERPSFLRTILLAAALAATAATRAQSGALLLVVVLGFLIARRLTRRSSAALPLPRAQFLAAPFLTYGLWVLFWPDFWNAPFTGPWSVLQGFLEHGDRYTQATLWFGKLVDGPGLYPLLMLAITTPISILLLSGLGLGLALRLLRSQRAWLGIGLGLWFLLSVGKHFSGIANHGGIRHFVDAYVPLSIAGAAGLLWLARTLAGRLLPMARGRGAAALAVLPALLLLSLSIAEHPYEGCYYNRMVGGAKGAAGRFDLEPNGSLMRPLLLEALPSLESGDVLLIVGPTDLARQVQLPEGCLVFEVLPGTVSSFRQELVLRELAKRRVFVVAIQDRAWGRFDAFFERNELRLLRSVGPDALPLGIFCRVKDPAFYRSVGELFRS